MFSTQRVARLCRPVRLSGTRQPLCGPDSNNGRPPFLLRKMAQALSVSKMTAQRVLPQVAGTRLHCRNEARSFELRLRHEGRLTDWAAPTMAAT